MAAALIVLVLCAFLFFDSNLNCQKNLGCKPQQQEHQGRPWIGTPSPFKKVVVSEGFGLFGVDDPSSPYFVQIVSGCSLLIIYIYI